MGRPGVKEERLGAQKAVAPQDLASVVAGIDVKGENVERAYASQVPTEHRRRYAQFFTPPEVADLMAEWVVQCKPTEILDPAIGTGALVRAVLRKCSKTKIIGFDIDPLIAKVARAASASNSTEVSITIADFLVHDPSRKYQAIIANPPYLRHHDLKDSSAKIAAVSALIGTPLSRLTNSYGLFLLDCCRRLEVGGRLAFVIPTEWTNANFGDAIKSYLLENDLLKYLIYTCNNGTVFEDALTTASILLIEKSRKQAVSKEVVTIFVPEHHALPTILQITSNRVGKKDGVFVQKIKKDVLFTATKWDSIIRRGIVEAPPGFIPLRSLARTKRGIATGANSFFHVSKEEAEKWGLPNSALRECIGRAADVKNVVFGRKHFEVLVNKNRSTFLVCMTGELSQAELGYIQHGEEQGFHLRYLTKQRQPWHSTEKMSVAPIWAAVFGRDRIRFIFNEARVCNLTTFHGIFPTNTDTRFVRAMTACLNSEIAQELMKVHLRVYGGGLNKFEPRDLLDIWIPDLSKAKPETLDLLDHLLNELDQVQEEGDTRLTEKLNQAVLQAANDASTVELNTPIGSAIQKKKRQDQLSLSLP